ncbi:helix-hairpin-helix domain-containing protein [Streptomyces altiplanensis]
MPTHPSAPATGAGDEASAPDGEAAGGGGVGRVRSAVRERLPVWVQSRCGLEPRTLAALAVVLVVAAVFAAQHFWAGRPQPVQPPEIVGEGAAAARPEPSPSPGPPPTVAADGPGPGEGRIVIDVSGKVRRPGIHRLPAGSRVADALRAAGGVKAGADTAGLNRARLLMDGEQVVVGVPAPAGAAGPAAGGGAPVSGQAAAPIGLGSATAEQLETLPGVGPVLAQHIIDYRTEHGGFRSVDELREVKGIGDRRFADLRPLVRP